MGSCILSLTKLQKKVQSESEFNADSEKKANFGQGLHPKVTKNSS